MNSGLLKMLALAWLILPGMAWADFLAERIGQANGTGSLLIQPPVAIPSHEPLLLMFSGPYDATRLGLAMDYSNGAAETDVPFRPSLTPQPLKQRLFATAVGEVSLSERIGLFGKFGLRYSTDESTPVHSMITGMAELQQLDQRYGVGLSVRASQVLSLRFEWERYAPGAAGSGAEYIMSDWDPWKEKNVFGAGLRLGF